MGSTETCPTSEPRSPMTVVRGLPHPGRETDGGVGAAHPDLEVLPTPTLTRVAPPHQEPAARGEFTHLSCAYAHPACTLRSWMRKHD
jgi:hypothetical protein